MPPSATGRFLRKIKPTKNALQRISQLAEWRVGKLLRLHIVKTRHCCRGQILLALKVMEEPALGYSCLGADIIDSSCAEPALPHEGRSGIHELALCFRQLFRIRSIQHTD